MIKLIVNDGGSQREYVQKVMNSYLCLHLMFNYGYLIEFLCLKSDLIDSYDN